MANDQREALDLIVYKKDLHLIQIVPASDTPRRPGQVRIRLDKFSLTSNNITYAAFGEALSYWKFFPVAQAGWGSVPVWGFGDVVESCHEAVREGERLFGYFPISTHLTIDADRITEATLVDRASHRAELPPVYNQYFRMSSDPEHKREREGLEALFRPLFGTGFLLDDSFAEKGFLGAEQVILSSASSKTALSLAYLLSRSRSTSVEVVGLTSARHSDFVGRVGYFDRVLTYAEIAGLDAARTAIFVDFGGDAKTIRAVHAHFGNALKYSCQVGATHWEEIAQPHDLPGPKPEMFFAPDHARRRAREWGAAAFQTRVSALRDEFIEDATRWIRIVEGRGPKQVEKAYRTLLNGDADPAEGYILSL